MDWDELLFYIKDGIGATKESPLEISDEEIIDTIKMKSLPTFSKYIPNEIYRKITFNDIIKQEDLPQDINVFKSIYKIPNVNPPKIREIQDVYYTEDFNDSLIDDAYIEASLANAISSQNFYKIGTIYDDVELKNYIDNTFITDTTFEFIQPDKVLFRFPKDKNIETAIFILKLNSFHTDINTIPSDMEEEFKDLCLADIMYKVGRIRSKFEQINSPQGPISLNGQELKNEGMQLRREVLDKLEFIPPQEYMYFID